jgi:hypothetical protein
MKTVATETILYVRSTKKNLKQQPEMQKEDPFQVVWRLISATFIPGMYLVYKWIGAVGLSAT